MFSIECANKPFLSYGEQVERLKEKGITCDKPNEKKYIIRKGYFNLVNGYKKPFVIGKNGQDHRYIKGTSIEQLYKVMKFDRRLSGMLLRNITHVEEEVRSIAGYLFDKENKETSLGWQDIDAYDSKIDIKDIKSLIKDIKKEVSIAKKNNNEYIKHYYDKYDIIPTWVMMKVIRFTTFILFIKLSKIMIKKSICNLYGIEYKQRDNDFSILLGALNWMRKTRNSCAHNERIIFLKDSNTIVITKYHKLLTTQYKNRLRTKQVVDLIIFLKYFNTKTEYNKLINFLLYELKNIEHVVGPHVYDSIRASLGIRQVRHLEFLKGLEKTIEYLKLD